MKKPCYFWLELGIHAYLTIFQWIGLRDKDRQNQKKHVSYVLPCLVHPFMKIGVSEAPCTQDIGISQKQTECLTSEWEQPCPLVETATGSGMVTIDITPELLKRVVTSQWLLLEIHDVSKIYSIIMWAMKNTHVLSHQTGSLIGIPLV